MNIKEAKQEIINTIKAYRKKDEMGNYLIPVQKQRPILLIGPPGIGKTAIMEQVAEELSVNLVSYTITHHTRQSAIGLPFISKKEYGGKETSVTEYTMSEIIASVYDRINQTGVKEGILFLDEINCVSETLVPTMLQFLQYKTFGAHQVPEGFIIVTAGNPPQYNKAVRDFDIVTLDRVKRIDIEEDLEAFKEYADVNGVHGSILAYLDIHKDNFYSIKNDIQGKRFVTARGWEDLSQLIRAYEKLGIEVDEKVTIQYLQEPEIARDFAMYYALYHKYEDLYNIGEILKGSIPAERDKLRKAPFDEKLSIINLLIDRLNQEFSSYDRELNVQKQVQKEILAIVKGNAPQSGDGKAAGIRENSSDSIGNNSSVAEENKDAVSCVYERLSKRVSELMEEYDHKAGEHLMNKSSEIVLKKTISALEELEAQINGIQDEDAKKQIKVWFQGREKDRRGNAHTTGKHLSNCFTFLQKIYGEEQEMVLFLTRLDAGHYSLNFIQNEGSEEYYKYNQLLLLRDRRREIVEQILEV
ncbi:ATP-binding protein [Butyrivibrio sp. LC3010]|uniref:ATP-binding protein n=1 Tax=Butyrivibrio sp. LC3010 TaxID=1280680 RepID=UPI000401658E|nr:MoxR family ATPase [Butyrivibrio sp. LC3010]